MRTAVLVFFWVAYLPTSSEAGVVAGEFSQVDELLIGWEEDAAIAGELANIVAVASWQSRVTVLVPSRDWVDGASRTLRRYPIKWQNVRLELMQNDSLWVRDFGPFQVGSGANRRYVDFLYPGREADDVVPARLAKRRGIAVTQSTLRMDGGNMLTNGQGVCVSTEQLIHDNAGTHTLAAVRAQLRRELGCKKLVILPALDGEPTGHVDMYMTITGPKAAIVGRYSRRQDRTNARRLDLAATLLTRQGFVVRRVPMPSNRDGLFRTHVNALVINGTVLVPLYRRYAKSGRQALAVFRRAYPDRKVIGVYSDELITLGGSLHCVGKTMSR